MREQRPNIMKFFNTHTHLLYIYMYIAECMSEPYLFTNIFHLIRRNKFILQQIEENIVIGGN